MDVQTTLLPGTNFPYSNNHSYTDFFENKRSRQTPMPTPQFAIPKLKENLFLSSEALLVVGENGKHRFDEFKRHKDGWFGGKGREMSKYSLAVFESFITKIPELKLFHPSLFLTLAGNIELGLEDKSNQSMEIEFYPDKIEYFIESFGEESSIGLAGIFELAAKIRQLLQ